MYSMQRTRLKLGRVKLTQISMPSSMLSRTKINSHVSLSLLQIFKCLII